MKKKIFIAVTLALSLLLTGCSDFDYGVSDTYATVKGYKTDPMPTDLVIPNEIDGKEVITIAANSFRDQSGIRSIALPSSLKTIERGAFENCINLSQVVFPNSLTDLSGFKGCSGLTSISLSNATVKINEEAFMNCSALSNITFSPSTLSIGDRAFANCTALKSIDFTGSRVECIAKDAFSGCTNIESVSLTKAFIETYIASDTAPSESFASSLYDRMRPSQILCKLHK